MLVKHWQRVAETRFKYHKKIQMAVDEARACRHPHGLKDKLKPNPTQQDALKGILPLKKVSVSSAVAATSLLLSSRRSGWR